MTLGEYVRQLMRGRSYRDVAIGVKAAGAHVARGTIHGIVSGETIAPNPETLKALALYFGKTDQEQREVYATMMNLAGYLDLMPQEPEPTAGQKVSNALGEGGTAKRPTSDEVLRLAVDKHKARGTQLPTGLEGLAAEEDEEQEA